MVRHTAGVHTHTRNEDRDFATKAEAITAITEYIEGFYNSRRRHSSLGCVSPLLLELQHTTERLAA